MVAWLGNMQIIVVRNGFKMYKDDDYNDEIDNHTNVIDTDNFWIAKESSILWAIGARNRQLKHCALLLTLFEELLAFRKSFVCDVVDTPLIRVTCSRAWLCEV